MATRAATLVALPLLLFAVVFARANPQQPGLEKDTLSTAQNSVAGHVEAGGKPVKSGKLLVYLPENQIRGSVIKDGQYTLLDMPIGEFPVSIDGIYVAEEYATADSRLTISVQATGNKEWNFHVMSLEPEKTAAGGY